MFHILVEQELMLKTLSNNREIKKIVGFVCTFIHSSFVLMHVNLGAMILKDNTSVLAL